MISRQDLYWENLNTADKRAVKFWSDINAWIDNACDAVDFESLNDTQQDYTAQWITATVDKIISRLEAQK